jgi:hypothetical protein
MAGSDKKPTTELPDVPEWVPLKPAAPRVNLPQSLATVRSAAPRRTARGGAPPAAAAHVPVAGVTGGERLPPMPPLRPSLVEVARWLKAMHGLTDNEVREVILELLAFPFEFCVDGEQLMSWNGVDVNLETSRARWEQDPPDIDHPLLLTGWRPVEEARGRLRLRREREAAGALATGSSTNPQFDQAEAATSKVASSTPAIAPPRAGAARGGRPPTYDWAAFSRELTREANLSAFVTRAAMAAHMRKYVENNWETQPDAETLRRRLKEWFYHDDLPE